MPTRQATVSADIDDPLPLVTASGFAVRLIGHGSPPSLSVRAIPQPGSPADPLEGYEVWHAVTDTVVLSGLRETRLAEQLLDLLDHGPLSRIRLRMSAGSARTPADTRFGTVGALTTLACWPPMRRAALVRGVAASARVALDRMSAARVRPGTTTLRWLLKLAEEYPADPMVLAPLLLQFHRHETGTPYAVPPGQPFAHLSGEAVGIASAHASTVGGGLGSPATNSPSFALAVATDPGAVPREPAPAALRSAFRLAATLSRHPR